MATVSARERDRRDTGCNECACGTRITTYGVEYPLRRRRFVVEAVHVTAGRVGLTLPQVSNRAVHIFGGGLSRSAVSESVCEDRQSRAGRHRQEAPGKRTDLLAGMMM